MGAAKLKLPSVLFFAFVLAPCIGAERKTIAPFFVAGRDVFVSDSIVCSSNNTPCATIESGALSLCNSEFKSVDSETILLRDGCFLSLRDSKMESFSKPIVAIVSSSTNCKSKVVVGSSTLRSSNAPLFHAINSKSSIVLRKGADLRAGKELLLCSSSDGGKSEVSLSMENCAVSGAVSVESGSSCKLHFEKGADFSGIVSKGTNTVLDVTVEKGARVVLKGDWHVTTFKSKSPTFNFIDSRGYSIYYDPVAESEMNSRRFHLNGGGMLEPDVQKEKLH